MNGAHFHLVVNHLPIIFPVVGIIVLATGFISKSEAIKRTALLIFILGGLSAILAMSSGEGAEEIVEKIKVGAENLMEAHEEAAERFALLSYVLSGLSLFGLWFSFRQKAYSNLIAIGILVFAIIVLFFAKQTGTSGGEISHPEIVNSNNSSLIDIKKDHEGEDD